MNRRVANNINELIDYWNDELVFEEDKYGKPLSYHRINDAAFNSIFVNFNLELPFSEETQNKIVGFKTINSIKFDNCKFLKINIENWNKDIEFNNKCFFPFKFKSSNYNNNITFRDSNIRDIDFQNAIFGDEESKHNKKGKIRFRNCTFNDVNFRNTTFNNLADFWRCTFKKPVIFYKTDFNATTVFSASTFKKNVLFTYTLIDKFIIFRGTNFVEGLDLSLAIISGKIGTFDLRLTNYNTIKVEDLIKEDISNEKYLEIYENCYEDCVSEKALIPINNKRETFRIIKQNFVAQDNIHESLIYKKLEKETLRTELISKNIKVNPNDSLKIKIIKYQSNLEINLDRFNLWLNKLSNNHGSSFGRAFLFILLFGWLMFYSSLLATKTFSFSYNISQWEFGKGLEYFVQYLLPTHKFDYMGENVELTSCYYFFDFIGRIIIGYGLYQFIQAFRKFR